MLIYFFLFPPTRATHSIFLSQSTISSLGWASRQCMFWTALKQVTSHICCLPVQLYSTVVNSNTDSDILKYYILACSSLFPIHSLYFTHVLVLCALWIVFGSSVSSVLYMYCIFYQAPPVCVSQHYTSLHVLIRLTFSRAQVK